MRQVAGGELPAGTEIEEREQLFGFVVDVRRADPALQSDAAGYARPRGRRTCRHMELACQLCNAGSARRTSTTKPKSCSRSSISCQPQLAAGNLSHGQQQWLEIGMAIALRPKLLLLDEPTAGMSPEETFKTGELVKRLNADGMTIVVIEHDMTFVRQIARKVTGVAFAKVFLEAASTR